MKIHLCFAGRLRASVLVFLASVTLVGCQLSLEGGHSVSGTVTDAAGAGVGGVIVSAEGTSVSASTDASGRYTLTGLPGMTATLRAKADGLVLAARFASGLSDGGPTLTFNATATTGADFLAVAAGSVTIPVVQGAGASSPLAGVRVDGIRGVVTMVTRQFAHPTYTTALYDGTTTPQWVSQDGFFLEAVDGDKDGDEATSDGIFISTHDDAYEESKWIEGIPTDLVPGQMVVVSGTVEEHRPVDRYGSSDGYLTVTRIVASSVVPVTSSGVRVTHAFPKGVRLTMETTPSGETDWRTLNWGLAGSVGLVRAVSLLESVEGMVVRVVEPWVGSSTYYNLTGVIADGGARSGTANPNLNPTWRGLVLAEDDYNPEILYADYQKPSWTTFSPIPQVGDVLNDSTGAAVLRGVMDYTADPVYMIRPLQLDSTLTDSDGGAVPSQGWGFDSSQTFYPSSIQAAFQTLSSSDRTAIADWRIGSAAASAFKVGWTGAEAGWLTVASFNFENYIDQGASYSKQSTIANVLLYNLKAPDVVVCVEMGDDNNSTIVYANQDGSYSIPDGVVAAVQNYRGLIDTITSLGGPTYDFREVAPEEGVDGGAPGNNIRVGFLFRTDRVAFVDRGWSTNTYATTGGAESTWPVVYPSLMATAQARASTGVGVSASGAVQLTQSPGRLQGSSFSSTRKPLVGEFKFLSDNRTFFVIGNHLSSKGGDDPLYGVNQPPTMNSEAKRSAQAKVVNAFVRSILAVDSNARIIVAGDLNDYQFSRPLKLLTGETGSYRALYSPTAEWMPAHEQFSYAFRGNLQQIDHILVSPALFTATDPTADAAWADAVSILHIDSPFSKNNHIQVSDHDPVAVRLNWSAAP